VDFLHLAGLMARLRAHAHGAASAVVQGQRWRAFYADLADPCIASLLDRHLSSCNRQDLALIRPLQLPWAQRYDRDRTVRAMIVAAGNDLCRAAWLVTCSLCLKRNVHSEALSHAMHCFGCRRVVKRSAVLPSELVFCGFKGGLGDGLLPDYADLEPAEALCSSQQVIPCASSGLLFPKAVSRRLKLYVAAGRTQTGKDFGPSTVYSVAVEADGPERVNLCASLYPGHGILLRPGAPIVVRNSSATLPMLAKLVPTQSKTRICEATALNVAEYADLFP
jgi:hypothetical protein